MATQNLQYLQDAQRLGDKTLFSTAVTNKNGSQVRYFSGTDAEIYFGETYIDEVVQISIQLQQNTMPLFGYNSFVFDEIAQGSRMIQGSFTINYTKAAYLYDVINNLANITSGGRINVPKDRENTPDEESAIIAASSVMTMTKKNAMWDKSFEICISYGDNKSGVANSTMAILEGVWITGVSQEFGINGDPIFETYTYLARDISYGQVTSAASVTTSVEKETEVLNILSLRYYDSMDNKGMKHGNLVAELELEGAVLTSVQIEPKLDVKSDKGLRYMDIQNPAVTAKFVNIPNAWRLAIKENCIANGAIATDCDCSVIVNYSMNGSSTTKTLFIKASITAGSIDLDS